MFKTPAIGHRALGSQSLGALALKRAPRTDQQQGAWDLRDAQNIFASEPTLLGGIWLPDLAMMRQDSAGQTAATSGAVVGLVYDQSAGVNPRNIALVTNFSSLADTTATVTNDAEYDPITGLLIADKIAATVGGTYHSKSFSITSLIKVGCRYRIGVYVKPSEYSKIIISDGSNGYFARAYDTVALTTANVSGSVGAYAAGIEVVGSWFLCWLEFVKLNGNSIKISIISYPDNAPINNYGAQYSGDGTSGAYFSQLSVIEIASGTHAFQPTTANKPTLLNWQSTGKYGFFPSADNIALTATFPSSLGSACTEFVTTPDGVEILEGRTVGTTYNIADCYFFGRILLNRACTPYEKALFTRMLTRYIPKTSLYKYDFAITQTGGGAADLKIVTASATPVYIEWGDGTGGTVASNTTLSHTYAATYEGNVWVSSLSPVTQWTSANGKWSFDLAKLPRTLNLFYCAWGTITGNLLSFPDPMRYIYCAGNNIISGNLSNIPVGTTFLRISGYNTISDYGGKTWGNDQQRVQVTPVSPGGLSSAEVDQLLIDLAAAGGAWTLDKIVNLVGSNAARTSVSDAAVATLQGKGVTVTTN